MPAEKRTGGQVAGCQRSGDVHRPKGDHLFVAIYMVVLEHGKTPPHSDPLLQCTSKSFFSTKFDGMLHHEEVYTARAMIPVMMPVLSATIMCGAERTRLLSDGGFRPFFK